MRLSYRRSSVACMLGCLLATCGCVADQYELELIPAGEQLQRKLQVTGDGERKSRLTEEDLTRIARAYQQSAPRAIQHGHEFSGKFAGRQPLDIGGYGQYQRLESPCGVVSLYLERFRGNDDLVAELNRRFAAIDRVVKLLSDWIAEIGKGDASTPRLREFVQQELRSDLQNLCLYAYTQILMSASTGIEGQPSREVPVPERMSLFLIERDYLTFEELPRLIRSARTGDEPELSRWVRTCLWRKLRGQSELPEGALSFLADWEQVGASLEEFLRKSAEFATLQAQRPADMRQELSPWEVLQAPVMEAFLPGDLFSAQDAVTVRLKLPTMPFTTNGLWNTDSPEVEWDFRVQPGELTLQRGLPRLAYAGWAEPKADYQRARFGRVLLDGTDLAQYNLWYAGLSADEAREWDDWLAKTGPGSRLGEQIERFQFRQERQPAPDQPDRLPLVAPVAELINNRLNAYRQP